MPKIVYENNVHFFPELNQELETTSEARKKIAIFIATEHVWVVLPLKQWILDLISIINNRTDQSDSINKARDACDKLDTILEERNRIKSSTLIHNVDFVWFYQDEW